MRVERRTQRNDLSFLRWENNNHQVLFRRYLILSLSLSLSAHTHSLYLLSLCSLSLLSTRLHQSCLASHIGSRRASTRAHCVDHRTRSRTERMARGRCQGEYEIATWGGGDCFRSVLDELFLRRRWRDFFQIWRDFRICFFLLCSVFVFFLKKRNVCFFLILIACHNFFQRFTRASRQGHD